MVWHFVHLFPVWDNIIHVRIVSNPQFPLNDDYKQAVVSLSALMCILQQLKRKHDEIRQKYNGFLCVGTSIKIIMLNI